MTKILMIVTGADRLTLADGASHPTGYWAEELAASHKVFRDAGAEVDIATPGGIAPTVDAISLDSRGGVSDADAATFRDYLASISYDLTNPRAIADVDASAYDAIYIPGGHGPMADLATDSDLGRLLTDADGRGQVIAALCHGPAALLAARRPDGTFTFAGRRLVVFTDEEERQGGLGDTTPWWVETTLRERGATVETGMPWSNTVVVDDNLVTGQNPQSSVATAQRVLKKLGVPTGN
ncbi:type 1 glutamine amidotransferase domain-containing protein [Micromonospora sp. CB01531]|uniref:type 1 glutamine amidotransferase domain-containing protein n=1 Tax=Micromonospora sp. CB01531 TaxID=1718947 RepID=UPI00093AAA43|nr:type 1 glutamine amidotransferase domain-containing protein [Micromonospora sp. CB01531]OKI56386.1 thiamine biosynthesis protein ThiJ [Micromonospora sp. CB01531]